MTVATSQQQAEPFVKWAGGKRRVARHLSEFIPELGRQSTITSPSSDEASCAVGFQPPRAILGDTIDELVETFVTVRDQVDDVIAHLRSMPYDAAAYYRIRRTRPRSASMQAARFIYLNKTCFNGLYRVNLRGQFNVPFGKHGPALVICDENQLRAASLALSTAKIISADFENTLSDVRSGDVVYCDPPYTLATRTTVLWNTTHKCSRGKTSAVWPPWQMSSVRWAPMFW